MAKNKRGFGGVVGLTVDAFRAEFGVVTWPSPAAAPGIKHDVLLIHRVAGPLRLLRDLVGRSEACFTHLAAFDDFTFPF